MIFLLRRSIVVTTFRATKISRPKPVSKKRILHTAPSLNNKSSSGGPGRGELFSSTQIFARERATTGRGAGRRDAHFACVLRTSAISMILQKAKDVK
ncbi:hypothetical protein EVAR_50184_1 [Eumeta japonica]|uniref:Uncharacterized protein n=1 Tax=Eumeta variegata TaxID=151549 RepID=A0A4C1WY21_EUMVA|nr:hypothetical protein EVAR_50184_1 [Eumeta japonica]